MSQSIITLAVLVMMVSITPDTYAQFLIPCHNRIFNFTPRHSLNISEFMGNWFMQEIAGSDIGNFPEPDYRCSRRTLTLPDPADETMITAIDSFVNITEGTLIKEPKSIVVNATRSPLSSVWTMSAGEQETDVIILFADLEFKQWTVVYACSIIGPFRYRHETVTAMTRTREISPELRRSLKALMIGQGFRIGDHHPIDQNNCEVWEN